MVLYPAKNEEIYGIVPYQKFSCHVTLLFMWVTSGSYVGHIRIVLWVSGSNGSTGVTHFQPWCKSSKGVWEHRLCVAHQSQQNLDIPDDHLSIVHSQCTVKLSLTKLLLLS